MIGCCCCLLERPNSSFGLRTNQPTNLVAHPTRQPVQKKDVTTMMGTIQRQLRLQPGGSGGWNVEAQRRLETLLANPKRSAQQLALEDRKPEDKMPEDKKSSSDS